MEVLSFIHFDGEGSEAVSQGVFSLGGWFFIECVLGGRGVYPVFGRCSVALYYRGLW